MILKIKIFFCPIFAYLTIHNYSKPWYPQVNIAMEYDFLKNNTFYLPQLNIC